MYPRRTIVLLSLLQACALLPARAQEPSRAVENPSRPDSLGRVNNSSVVFERNLNTYTWLGRAALDTAAGELRFKLREQYSSNVILPEGTPSQFNPKLQSSEQSFFLDLRYPATDLLTPVMQWSSFTYSDNKGTGLNNASSALILGGAEYFPFSWFSITPLAGYQWDGQAGIYDRGATYVLQGRIPGVIVDGYHIEGAGQFREEKVSPRTLEEHFFGTTIQRSFSQYTWDSVGLGFARNRREFYSPSDFGIESRTENVVSFSNQLHYEISPEFGSLIFVSVNDRILFKDLRPWNVPELPQIQFNTRIDEFHLDTYALLTYRSQDNRYRGWLRLGHSERTESHEAERPATSSPLTDLQFATRNNEEHVKNNTSQQTSLSGGGTIAITSSDTVAVSGTASILRYDTPSIENVEDRDELLVALGITTLHQFSRVLSLALTLEGTLGHTVYLLKERSRNNAINRILRLSPRTVYRPVSWITSANAFEILANYTVYDFEAQLASIKSYSYRQLTFLDSTAFDLTHSLGIDLFTYWKVYERGQLIWSEFRERPENIVNEQTHALQVRVRPTENTVFALGLRYFGQSRYTYQEGVRRLDTFLRSVGPTCLIQWEPGNYSRIQFRGWYENRRLSNGTSRTLPSFDMNIGINL
jgi:hypothetical protein